MNKLYLKVSSLIICLFLISYSINYSIAQENDQVLNYNKYFNLADSISNPTLSLKYAERALEIAKELNDQRKIGVSYFLIGNSYSLLGDLSQALNFHLKATTVFKKLHDDSNLALLYNSIATDYALINNYRLSSSYIKKAISINKVLGDEFDLAGDYNNLGETYRHLHYFDSALIYFNSSLNIYNQSESKLGVAYTLGNIGLVHAELDQYDSAEYYIHQATEILEELGDRYPIAVYQTYMADIYQDKQDWDRALEYAHNSLQIAKEEGLKEQIRDASLKLSEIYHDTEEFEKAYDYQSQYIAYRDSINNEDVIRKMADLRTEYEVSKKQAEVDLLEQKRENEKWVLFSLLSVLGFISVVAFFTFRNNLARKRTNMLLSAQKSRIESQNDKLEGLVKMKDKFFGIISHDLRGPVNSLNGITQLLKHYVATKNSDELTQLTILMDKSVDSLSTLLDNLLSWALSQQGALPYDPKKISVDLLIKNVVDVFKNAARAKSIEVGTEIEEGLELFVDEDSVNALLRNVLNNAIKFTPEKGTIKITAKKEKSNAVISIADNGFGMNDYQLRNLFKVNKKKVNKGTGGEKGSGLGMLLCKEIVKLNKGKIDAESAEGKGTSVVVELPMGDK